jgi:hypothetical protein
LASYIELLVQIYFTAAGSLLRMANEVVESDAESKWFDRDYFGNFSSGITRTDASKWKIIGSSHFCSIVLDPMFPDIITHIEESKSFEDLLEWPVEVTDLGLADLGSFSNGHATEVGGSVYRN